jgi:hypothetical protein
LRIVIRLIGLSLVFLLVAYSTFWGTLAFHYKLPASAGLNWIAAAAFALLGLATLIAIFRPVRWRWLPVFFVALIGVNIWWNTLAPPTAGNWSPEVARQTTGSIDGDILTLENVRAFEWRTEDDFTPAWETRRYDLSRLETVDLFMSYWGGPAMAHLMLSFGFADGEYLTWSNEVRREVGEEFSPMADFFKAHPLAVIAGTEQDLVGLRSNVQGARVVIFRLRSTPERRRRLIEAYVAAANTVAQEPVWFNSVFTNCSRSAVELARYVGIDLPMDWRVLVNGYFPEYLYERGGMTTEVSIEELYRSGDTRERAEATGLTEAFSEAIREGVPRPDAR